MKKVRCFVAFLVVITIFLVACRPEEHIEYNEFSPIVYYIEDFSDDPYFALRIDDANLVCFLSNSFGLSTGVFDDGLDKLLRLNINPSEMGEGEYALYEDIKLKVDAFHRCWLIYKEVEIPIFVDLRRTYENIIDYTENDKELIIGTNGYTINQYRLSDDNKYFSPKLVKNGLNKRG